MLCKSTDCLSCCSCYSICPRNAITMEEDELGKLIPIINQTVCVNCGLCERACPQIQSLKGSKPALCYAGYLKDSADAEKSASGGFATAISRCVLDQGGIVYGATFQNGILTYSCGFDEAFLKTLRGSKYVYSFPGKIYKDIKESLNIGKTCLFIGLPCQVVGLRCFLGRQYDNLLTVDLICHGAPPFKYLKEHIKHLGFSEEYGSVTFRGERDSYLTLRDNYGKLLYSREQQEDEYFKAFMSGLLHRECCYKCPFACATRFSDITIGDFWGLSKGSLNGYKGRISCALINSEKGRLFFKEASADLILEERKISEAIEGNDQLRFPPKKHKSREIFEEAYKQKGFFWAMKVSGISKMVKKTSIKNKILWVPRKIKHYSEKKLL